MISQTISHYRILKKLEIGGKCRNLPCMSTYNNCRWHDGLQYFRLAIRSSSCRQLLLEITGSSIQPIIRGVKIILAFVLFAILTPSFAQQSTPQAASPDGQAPASKSQPAPPPKPAETVLVTGTFEPIPLQETQRSVMSIDVQQAPLLFSSDVDYLRLDPSIDLQERAPGGVQSDVSIRGSTFGQTLVLIDGLRVSHVSGNGTV